MPGPVTPGSTSRSPAGVDHGVSKANNAARLMQAIADVDFTVEAKFDSVVTDRYQEQGLMVEGSRGHRVRFGVVSDGTNTYLLGTRFKHEKKRKKWSKDRFRQAVPTAAPIYLRLTRQKHSWMAFHSFDGEVWEKSGSFQRPMVANSVGVFAGNDGDDPAHTAVIDYFFNSASPIVAEDQGAVSGESTLVVNTLGNGLVDVDPDQPTYSCNEPVTLTAQPGTTWAFTGWSGDAVGDDNPLDVVMSGDKTITANFEVVAAPAVITDIQIGVTGTTATIDWTTDQLADSSVAFGTTTLYELGSVDDPTFGTSYSVTLTNLLPGTAYHAQITSENELGLSTSSADLEFTTPSPPVTGGIVSDDFNACAIEPSTWTFVDPLLDSSVALVGGGTGDAQLHISVPAGVSHDPWNANVAARLMQSAVDGNLEIEAKFDSPVSEGVQEQGLMIESAAGDWLRFDVSSDGSATQIFGGSVVGGIRRSHFFDPIPSVFPITLRLRPRDGSLDGDVLDERRRLADGRHLYASDRR